MMNKGKRFRELLDKPGLVLRVCAYDALSAKLIEQAGFELAGTTGYGIAAANIGEADYGLMGFEGCLDHVRRIVNAVTIPVDMDADAGFGNALNVYHTTKQLAAINLGSIRIEDQVATKRCGHMSGKALTSSSEMEGKIKAALMAVKEMDSDMVIGIRTDAFSVEGFDKTMERVITYSNYDIGYLYIECPGTLQQLKAFVQASDVPIAMNTIKGAKNLPYTLEELESVGVKYLSQPMTALYSATRAMQIALAALRRGDLPGSEENQCTWGEFNSIVGIDKLQTIEKQLV